ncbi:MAG TPA: NAD(P) transhydrogenase subunit alpha [Candidatus Competibacteraceae bacterium]|nr:NAD(P) transhydrogenase subunit alpha [Candidatus Competibacteraceae bacterium]MCP5132166.1 NAD(P) transhydrogenase subunit alpha [Gammaproteobacteria bacterium]HPF58090.1 NAD(P) transhydrogenase subunit alpha [Candidatus Competibacteraceae bacterium]HRY19756.1 NAD(P) transhydrogenase subunit alpha [Candidatus Competibacteraceae bacterium]
MPVRMAVPKEMISGEQRVALDPTMAERFTKLGVEILVEKGAGLSAFFTDETYSKSSRLVDGAQTLYAEADVVFKVQGPTLEEVELLKDGSVLLAVLLPHRNLDVVKRLCDKKITSFAMELIPRISRAQSMDVLSSQAAVAGYYVALRAAILASGFFPMLTTAAGTIRPSKVVIVGAGVAGLQAIATAKRLGAMVEAYDIRPAARQEIESLGAKMIDTGVNAAAEGGYARELTAEEKQKQAEVLAKHIAAAHAVITTAAIPGRAAPKIVTAAMVENMKRGAVIVDLAAESGGNCDLTRPGETYEHNGVVIDGPLNIPSNFPVPASEMYAKNLFNFLSPMIKDGALNLDWDDEVIAKSALTRDGQVVHEPTRKLLEQ